MHGRTGVLGQVGSSGSMSHVECSVGFKLQPPAAGARILSAGLRCAMLNKGAAQRGRGTARSAFTADLGKLARSENKVRVCAALSVCSAALKPREQVCTRISW